MDKLDSFIKLKNYRPLLMSDEQIFDILSEVRFTTIGFYAVKVKTQYLNKELITLRYVLFDAAGKPYNFDGTPTSLLAPFTRHLKSPAAGVKINHRGESSYRMNRAELNSIFNSTSNPDLSEEGFFKYVVFMLHDNSSPSTVQIDLMYEVVEAFRVGGGGPASTATSPAP